jgi:hypothetical protein
MSRAHDERVRRFEQRALVRAWEYRQRHHARGVWFRLRRLLTDADRAFVVSADDARALQSEGYRPDPVGADLHPAKTILVIPSERAASLQSATPIHVGLHADLLAAECIVLTPFREYDHGAGAAALFT